MLANSKLEREFAELDALSREELSARWQKQYGCSPPTGARHELLLRSAAWHLQAKRLGGYSAETRRLLKAAMSEVANQSATSSTETVGDEAAGTNVNTVGKPVRRKPPRSAVQPGARLIRDWNGKTYIVDVIEGGYVFEAKVYRSLTAIAGKITNAHWSGPRFFGL